MSDTSDRTIPATPRRREEARRQILPFAEAQGYLTDEDVFRDVS